MTDKDSRARHRFEYSGTSIDMVLPSREDHISKALLADGFYEQPMLEALADALRPGDVVVDAGANIGNHTVYFAKVLGCRVTAFEAVPATAELLTENVLLNDLSDLVRVEAMALGARRGWARVKDYDETNLGATALEVIDDGALPVFPLEEVVKERPVRLLKIDVEGMERDVLEGARSILAEDRPWVLCEAADHAAYETVKALLADAGYSPAAVYNATDTYLFLPSRSEEERRQLLDHALGQVMELQREDRRIVAGQARANRYVERIRREIISEMARARQDGDGKSAGRPSGTDAFQRDPDDADGWRLHQALEFAERRNRALAAELDEIRSLLEHERDQAADCMADAERRIESGKQEIESLSNRALQLGHAVDEARSENGRLALDLRNEQAEHQERLASLRAELTAELVGQRGLVARLQRELADKHRRLTDAHRVLKLRNKEVVNARGMAARLEKRLGTVDEAFRSMQGEFVVMRQSLAFRLGSVLAGAARSPLALVALPWSVTRLLFGAWSERRRIRSREPMK